MTDEIVTVDEVADWRNLERLRCSRSANRDIVHESTLVREMLAGVTPRRSTGRTEVPSCLVSAISPPLADALVGIHLPPLMLTPPARAYTANGVSR